MNRLRCTFYTVRVLLSIHLNGTYGDHPIMHTSSDIIWKKVLIARML
jgi:hypothetical protein